MGYILVFDIGTTAVKACLFNRRLELLAHSVEEYRLLTPEQGRVELDPETYWRAVKTEMAGVCRAAGLSPGEIEAITITTQGETLIPVDSAGRALRNAVVWLDERAVKQAAKINERFSPELFYSRTGISECNGYCPVSKILWIKEEEPEIYRKTHMFLLLEDYIISRFTGEFVTEKSLLGTTGYFDIISDEYWEEMLVFAGIDPAKLPRPLECGTALESPVLPEIRSEWGLSAGVKIISSAMDQITAATGAGNLKPGIITETTGTGMCIAAASENPNFANPARVTIYRHIHAKTYLIIPVCMTAGLILKWFKDEFCADLAAEAKSRNQSVYARIDELASGAPPLSRGLVFVPYLNGVLQPDNNPSARGVFFGVGLNTGRPEFLRAILEGIGYMLKENIGLIEQTEGGTAKEIRSLGGGANSAIWRKIKADINGVDIIRMRENECTALGAAILAAVALGVYPSAASAAENANGIAERTAPDLLLGGQYAGAYQKYQGIYNNLKPFF
jgi:xylulokinase